MKEIVVYIKTNTLGFLVVINYSKERCNINLIAALVYYLYKNYYNIYIGA